MIWVKGIWGRPERLQELDMQDTSRFWPRILQLQRNKLQLIGRQLRKNNVATFNSRNLRTLTSPLLLLHHFF